MDWHEHFEEKLKDLDELQFLEQVGKTVSGAPISPIQLEQIVVSIMEELRLSGDDRVLDLCCGNGLLTRRVAEYCTSAVGVDFSEALIRVARKHNPASNVRYLCEPLFTSRIFAKPPEQKFTKLYMYEALQCFSKDERGLLFDLVENVSEPGLIAFFGSVPDKEKIWEFYDTPERKQEYQRRLESGNEAIGSWWDKQEIQECAIERGWNIEFIQQNNLLHTAHYRFDFRIERN